MNNIRSLANQIESLYNDTVDNLKNNKYKTKRALIKKALSISYKYTNGFFDDDYWQPVHKIMKEWDKAGIEYNIKSSRYIKNDDGALSAKRWYIELPWYKSKKPVYVTITASGAGTVDEPLSRYDVTTVIG